MLIIGIAGGSGSGKTTVVNKIVNALPEKTVAVVPQDAYYYDNGHLTQEEKLKINFDHPNSLETELLIRHITKLKEGKQVQIKSENGGVNLRENCPGAASHLEGACRLL